MIKSGFNIEIVESHIANASLFFNSINFHITVY